MKKHVIALGRQFGSGGREIGRKLSESLGFAYYDRELLKLAAERAEVGEELFADKDEKAGNPWLFKAFYQGGPKVKQGQSAEDVLFQMQSEIIRELAEKEDCIIVGRCADLVLTGQDVDCLSLFICAPFEWRVHHRMELENLDEKAARALVERPTPSGRSIIRIIPAAPGACRRITTSASTAHVWGLTARRRCWQNTAGSCSATPAESKMNPVSRIAADGVFSSFRYSAGGAFPLRGQ